MYEVTGIIYNGTLLSGDASGTGGVLYAYNTTTGKQIWNITVWSGDGPKFAVADGYGVASNIQDCQLYSFGKGPTQTIVQSINGTSHSRPRPQLSEAQ